MFGVRKTRTIHVHVGPHKTGSTAIQFDLGTHAGELIRNFDVRNVTGPSLRTLVQALSSGEDDRIKDAIAGLVDHCSQWKNDLVISAEDLSGDLPGTGSSRHIYPRLWQSLNTLRRAFPKDRLVFYFFRRDPQIWLHSAYVQILKHRTKFKSFEQYCKFLGNPDNFWDQVTERPRDRLGENFVVLPYHEGDGFSASHAFFQTAFGDKAATLLGDQARRPNTSPSDEVVRLFELMHGGGASKHAIRTAKQFVLKPAEAVPTAAATPPDWPPKAQEPDWLAPDLAALWSRSKGRVAPQDQPNLMPDADCDLGPYRVQLIDASDEFLTGGRQDMRRQVEILEHRFRESPRTCFLLGLTISYLRRETPHTAHAAHLFQRLWAEEYPILLAFLRTRWLISTFQTFMDHGVNEHQRTIGAAAYFFTNTLKLYEAERALEGLPPDRVYANETPAVGNGFPGLDRFRVGGTDLMVNTNALLLELAAREDRAGRVLQEFLLRLKRAHSAFSRMDQSRIAFGVDIPAFANCWSFFEKPGPKE